MSEILLRIGIDVLLSYVAVIAIIIAATVCIIINVFELIEKHDEKENQDDRM